MTIATPKLHALVRKAGDNVGNASRLADRIGMSVSALLRGSKDGHLSTDVLLAVADVGDIDPLTLLRAAGRHVTARRIERLFAKRRLESEDERALMALDDESKRQLCRLIDGIRGG